MPSWPAGRSFAAAVATFAVALPTFVVAGGFSARAPHAPTPAAAVSPPHAFGAGQLTFEPTRGRAARGFDFVARGRGYALALGATRARIAVGGGALESRLVGASDREGRGVDRLRMRVNDLKGLDRRRWRLGIPTFGRVRYAQVYPGVDLVYHGRQGALEYDFTLAPGADPAAIALDLRGASRLRLTDDGDLVASVGGAAVRQHRPIAYQAIDGVRHPVSARFALDGNRVRFILGGYDRRHALVIDPSLAFAQYISGTGGDAAQRVVLDSSGNLYVAGVTNSDSLSNAGTVHGATDTGLDAFVMKLSPSGSRIWTTYLAGASDESPGDIAVDSSGHAHVAGFTQSSDFPVTANPQQGSLSGTRDAFVTSLGTDGVPIYTTYYGTANADTGYGIAVDGSGEAYVGMTTEIPPVAPATVPTHQGHIVTFDSTGAGDYDQPIGATGEDSVSGIGVPNGCSSSCDVFIAGHTKTTWDGGATHVVSAFVGRFHPAGVSFTWAFAYGVDQAGGEDVSSLDVDTHDNVTIFGTKTVPPDPPGSVRYAFGSRFRGSDGANDPLQITWANPPANGNSAGLDVTHDAQDNLYFVGTGAFNNGAHTDAIQDIPGGAFDGFAVKYYPGGGTGTAPDPIPDHSSTAAIVWATYMGGSTNDQIYGVATNSSGGTFVAGETDSGGWLAGAPSSASGASDAFLAKIQTNGAKINTHPPEAQKSRDAAFTYFVAKETNSTFKCKLEPVNGSFGACPPNYPGLADGSYTFKVEAFDRGGTSNGTPASQHFFVDNVAPDDFALTTPDDGGKTGSRPDFSWSAAGDATSGVDHYRVEVDNASIGDAPATTFAPGADIPQGPHTWKVVAVDKAGNERVSAARSFTVTVPLNTKLVISPNPALVGRNVTFDGTGSGDANHAIAKFEWDLDGDGGFERNTGNSGVTNATYPKAGTFRVGLRATDVAGLIGIATVDLHVSDLPGTQSQFGVTIDKGATFTNSPKVTVSAKFPPTTTSMLFSNDGGFLDPTTFEPDTEVAWELVSTGPERLPKTIYVRFLAGFVTNQTYQDDIILDERPPIVDQAAVAGTGAAPAAARTARLRTWKVKIKAHDTNSGVGRIQVTANKKKPGKLLRYKRKLSVKSAKRPKWARARDRAGNFSKWKKAR